MQQKVNHLEIPAELAFIMSHMEKSQASLSTEKHLGKIAEPLPSVPFRGELKLPSDIDYYSFSKVANIYFKHHLWEMKTDPIKTPFLSKNKESDYQESLALFKLILRFMNDPNLSGVKEKVLSDYIITKGIKNEKLRDEIYCQLANQTPFPPSKTLYKYLLKYVSDNAVNGYKHVCQQKLLQAGINHESRAYPPTNLEWHSNKKRVKMAVDATFPDMEIRPVPIESFTTAEEFAANALCSRGIAELSGWTVGYECGEDSFELTGSDFVMDILSEGELPSIFPKGKVPFLQLSGVSRPSKVTAVPLEIPNVTDEMMSAISNKKRSHSEDRLLKVDDFGLSSDSILNNRYFESSGQSKDVSSKSKSLDNLLNSVNYGLSENSRLNQRYHEVSKDGLTSTNTITKFTTILNNSRNETNNNSKSSKTDQPDLLEAANTQIIQKETSSQMTRSSGNLKMAEELEMTISANQINLTNILRKGRPRFVKGRRNIKQSSAMSDTSEAPSIASHVRRVRVPSQASDVDQFLDDLFMPVLDADDGLSDAKSLAASMKGGGKKFKKLTNVNELVLTPPLAASNLSMGFQPIPGVVTPTMSPPPMLIPTPVQGSFINSTNTTTPHPPPTVSQDGSALAFTYVPVPVYNIGGVGLPGMMSPKPEEIVMSNNNNTSNNNNLNINANGSNNASYQQAFIQNAVAQNMQIQQQLMMQNQALSTLLSQAVTSPQPTSLTSVISGLKINEDSVNDEKNIELRSSSRKSNYRVLENDSSEYITRISKTTPNTPKLSTASMEMELAGIMDPYIRARTVRIGKVEMAPTKEEMESAEGIIGVEVLLCHRAQEFISNNSMNSIENTNIHPQQYQEKQHRQLSEVLQLQQQQFREQQQHLTDSFAVHQQKYREQLQEQQQQQQLTESLQIHQQQYREQLKEQHQQQSDMLHQQQLHEQLQQQQEFQEQQKAQQQHLIQQQSLLQQQQQQLKEQQQLFQEQLQAQQREQQIESLHPSTIQSGIQIILPHHSVDENGKLELSELEMQDDDDEDEARAINSVHLHSMNTEIQRLTENRKFLLEQKTNKMKKLGTADEVNRKNSQHESIYGMDITDGRRSSSSHAPPPPPLPFVFPGSLSTKTGDKNRYNSMEYLSQQQHGEHGEIHEDDYQSVDDISTKLHPPNSSTTFMYTRNVPWNLQIRKEIFSPSESLRDSILRLTPQECSRLRTLLDEYSINLKNLGSTKHRLSTKKNIIEIAKDSEYYFSRLYPISSGVEGESQFLSISHKGVRLIRRVKDPGHDHFETLETYTFEDIGEISTIKSNGLQIVTHTGGRLIASTPKAVVIKDLLNTYLIEANASSYDYVKALGEFHSGDENAISFKKGDIIAVVPKRDSYTEKGWLYGIKDGSYGLFPAEFVEKLSPKSIRREMRVIANVTQRSQEREAPYEEEDEDIENMNLLESGLERQTDEEEEDEEEILKVRNASSTHYAWERKGPQKNHRQNGLEAVSEDDGKNPLLEFALQHFQDSLKMRTATSSSGLSGTVATNDWTWKDQVDLVKWTPTMISNSLLRLEAPGHNNLALESNQHEVDCVNTILMYCHKLESIRDEVYCQIMKQTTNNKSMSKDSCQKGWRLFTIIAAYFSCSEILRPYLFKYLESAAYDKRRAYHGTALVCLQNLRKTFKYGGRKNIPSIEEITAIVAGRSSKRQIYRLPGGTERIINTKSTTVVADVIDELCNFIGVKENNEKEEFSLYCIIEGELYTMPLSNRHYILDLTNGLQHQNEEFYLIFCRSVWHYPLRMDNPLYIEVVFNQIAPDYLEGHLLVMPAGNLEDEELVYDIAKVASLLHKAADMKIKPPQWVNMVQSSWKDVEHLTSNEAKGQVLIILSDWPLFGSSFFAVTRLPDAKASKKEEIPPSDVDEELLALNKHGVSFLDQVTHETILHYPFTEVISTRKLEIDDRVLYLDMKCGNLMSQNITRIKTFQADEIARLIRQYITIDQKLKGNHSAVSNSGKKHSSASSHFE
ncbi:unnamed protein product [Lepeophtheirus salmonis]|uniref:(salmon louse) hypothetical protein n=1 Tax=Lepeophtheirus salmonis TaxID=72036 RepID=A0A7R8HEA8_LEPSM|nr:unnamed protein product [Lepeophtheirus salmonis]CAF3038480.1 unnamed protein product [Lepeophtheirus salmonis]